ncbi:hypothetical protein BBAD15_g7699 [Beauveria bassiana D1-5]|uniref:U6 snRNA-associated Sm-like protein LSm1 n=1 Tax=Beauveria bassiana D1-5 TaxID=1245745 RepID=A0A0A2W1W6_BEABA|nr:hypothetical protein BBAD15_g7699 [Beauveria bassiana D1-5]
MLTRAAVCDCREADGGAARRAQARRRVAKLGSIRYISPSLSQKHISLIVRRIPPKLATFADGREPANIVLQSTTERIFALQPPSPPPTEAADSETTAAATATTTTPRGLYADIFHGIFLVRGENVLLLGEMDLDRDDIPPPGYEQGELALVRRLAEESKAREKSRDKARARKLARLGFEGDAAGEIVLL